MSHNWQICLQRLKVRKHQEGGSIFVRAGDEPYLVVIGFRSRFNTPGSTRVFTNSYKDDEWAENIKTGQEKNIPSKMGVISLPGVQLVGLQSLTTGTMPELVGAVVISMESDATSWRAVGGIVDGLCSAVRTELQRLVENGTPGLPPDLAAAAQRIRSAVEPGLLRALSLWVRSAGDPDDHIGVHFLVFPAVDASVESQITFPPIPNGTTGALKPRPLTLRFTGDGADYEVTGQVARV